MLSSELIYLLILSVKISLETGLEKDTVGEYAHRAGQDKGEVKYEGNFMVPINFGDIGAVLVTNEHHKEMHVKDIVLKTGDATTLTINCQSWVHSKFDNPEKRIFFSNKVTPPLSYTLFYYCTESLLSNK